MSDSRLIFSRNDAGSVSVEFNDGTADYDLGASSVQFTMGSYSAAMTVTDAAAGLASLQIPSTTLDDFEPGMYDARITVQNGTPTLVPAYINSDQSSTDGGTYANSVVIDVSTAAVCLANAGGGGGTGSGAVDSVNQQTGTVVLYSNNITMSSIDQTTLFAKNGAQDLSIAAASSTANNAQLSATQALADAAAASTDAAAAQGDATAAVADASLARVQASAAQADATQALADAATAQTTANTASTTATSAATVAAAAQTASNNAVTSDGEAVSGTTTGNDSIANIIKLTQSQYDNLDSVASDTLYVIVG